ncbi:MAG: T9SS type A sorting domain-containing protein [Flavobacteriaceae bacterium]
MKNLLLSVSMLCLVTSAYAQLYVSPNATTSTDSYVYVSDQLLFVEQDVNLARNTNDPTTVASIYLRNGSQLLQGNTASANSGNGFISIYQDSHADSYDYNYWCSPIGRAQNTGNESFGVYRLYDSLSVTNSVVTQVSPGFNATSSPLAISTRWLYRWNPATQRWVAMGTSSTGAAPGYGFTMKGTDVTVHADPYNEPQNQRYDFRGRPNNGNITVPVETTGITFTDGTPYYFTLSGNPYPSVLDLNLFFTDTDNDEIDSIRYWDEDRSINSHLYLDNKGGYGTWIPGPTPYVDGGIYTVPTFYHYDGAGNPASPTVGYSPAYVERLYVPVGQGFMISADTNFSGSGAGDGLVTFKNSHRATTLIKEGVLNFSEFRTPALLTPRLRIHTLFGDSHFRDMVILFHESSTNGFDRGLDATHPKDGAISDAYLPIQASDDVTKNLVIETLPYTDDKMMIPITFKVGEETTIKLKAAEIINPPFTKAYLYDKENNTYQEINEDPGNSNQIFTTASVLLQSGLYEGRFFITFKNQNLPNEDEFPDIRPSTRSIVQDVSFFQNNPERQLEVANPEGYDIKNVNIFDMAGKLVLSQENLGKSTKLTFPTHNFADAVYLVRLTTTDNTTIVYKINVVNK